MPGFTAFVRIDLRKFLIKYGVLKNFGSIVTEIFLENLFLKNKRRDMEISLRKNFVIDINRTR